MDKNTLNNFDNNIKLVIDHYRRPFIWAVIIALFAWLCISVQEIVFLFLFSYAISILIDPVVTRLEKKGVSRSCSIFGFLSTIIIILIMIIVLAVPKLISEYQGFVSNFDENVKAIIDSANKLLGTLFGITIDTDLGHIATQVRERAINATSEERHRVAELVWNTLFKGYSVTLTLVNLCMAPFFIFYMSRDLDKIHGMLGHLLPDNLRERVSTIGSEVVKYIHMFFKGQITVALIMACLYSFSLFIVGVKYSLLVGVIAGLVGVVPYLGVILGLILALLITFLTDGTLSQYIYATLAIFIPNLFEAFVLQPKIVGKSVGFNPFAVIVILLIGGQLFGIIGMIIAIPLAAIFMVVAKNLLNK